MRGILRKDLDSPDKPWPSKLFLLGGAASIFCFKKNFQKKNFQKKKSIEKSPRWDLQPKDNRVDNKIRMNELNLEMDCHCPDVDWVGPVKQTTCHSFDNFFFVLIRLFNLNGRPLFLLHTRSRVKSGINGLGCNAQFISQGN